MKFLYTLVCLFVLIPDCKAQYNPISQIIYGDGLHKIGYTISINGLGNRVALIQERHFPDIRTYAKVYDLIDSVWYQVGENILIGENMDGPSEIALNQEGNRLVVGTSEYNYRDFVKVYEFVANEWLQMGNDVISEFLNDRMGSSIDINEEGDIIIYGGGGEDYAKVFKFENNEWQQKGQTILAESPGDGFGYSVSINANGNIIAVAALLNDENGVDAGKLNLYEFVNNEWIAFGNSIYGQEGDKMGIANEPGNSGINLNREGNIVSMASYEHFNSNGERVGMAKVYDFANGSWTQKGQLVEGSNPNGYFGGSHSINDSGDILVIGDFYGATGEKAKVYSFENDSWVEYGNVLPELGNFFGFSLALNDEGNILAVGAPDDGGVYPSEARLYKYNGVLGFDDNDISNMILLFPNPNSGQFSLNFSEEIEVTSILVVDALGKTVYSETNISSGSFEIDHNFTAGLYFVNVISSSSEITLKMIVE